jgi:proline iminopeptidase
MRSTGVVRSAAVAVLAIIASIAAWPQSGKRVGPSNRAEATAIVAEMRRIVTPEGVEVLRKIHIGVKIVNLTSCGLIGIRVIQ